MSDFELQYDVLESIARNSNSLGRRADEYANGLTIRIANSISKVTGSSSGYLEDASYYVNQKIEQLQKKAKDFYDFGAQITTLAETAARADEEVQRILAKSQVGFLGHQESLRIDNWKADILNWLIGIKNSQPFLEVLGNILSTVHTILESCFDSIKYWYQCEIGKYTVETLAGANLTILAVSLYILSLSENLAIYGAIGAGIAAAKMVTSVGAAYAACNGDPTWARRYIDLDKMTDDISKTNANDGQLFSLSYQASEPIDSDTKPLKVIIDYHQKVRFYTEYYGPKLSDYEKKVKFYKALYTPKWDNSKVNVEGTGKTYVTKQNFIDIGWNTDSEYLNDDMVKEFNSMLDKYGITENEQIYHFLSQLMVESDNWYKKGLGDGLLFKGAGYLHLTGRYNYTEFYNYMKIQGIDDAEILNKGYECVSKVSA